MDALAEDVANADTMGYKKQRVTFRELVYVAAGTGAGAGVSTGAGAAVSVGGRSFSQGAMGDSSNPLDLAIDGPGLLRVSRPDGSAAYSRSAQLQVDARGNLTTLQGNLVDPPVKVPAGTDPKDINVNADGTVTVKGQRQGKLTLESVGAPDAMQAVGNGLFVTTTASGPARAAANTTLRQGQVEGSNVDLADTMVDMMDAQRNYSLASRAIQMQDQLLEVANGIKK